LQGDLTIEAQAVEDRGASYRVRTRQGTYDIEKKRVVRIEPGPGAQTLYEREKTRHSDTPSGHYEMAQWCAFHELASERLKHLKRVLELDADHAGARKALGFTRKDGNWVKTGRDAPADPIREARRRRKELEAEVRARVSSWFVQIRAIQKGRLDPKCNDAKRTQFADGRRQILAIRDPFSIAALADVLSRGDVRTRLLLAEALGRFEQDEATMNLIAMSLFDPVDDVRRAAAAELSRRRDDRMVQALRQAMFSDDERTLRHAATALGRLKARAAVPELISVLSTETIDWVRVTVPVYADYMLYLFGRPTGYWSGAEVYIYQPATIGVLSATPLMGTVDYYELAPVSVHRTEVQEALIAITGENLGFDRAAWQNWWRRNGR
jgi:HEAT repeat protein